MLYICVAGNSVVLVSSIVRCVETIDAVNGSQDVMYQLVMPFEDRKSLSHCPGDCINQSSSLKI